MVNFNNENTITTPSYDIVKILILEKLENCALAIGFYIQNKDQGLQMIGEHSTIHSRIIELWIFIEPWVRASNEETAKDIDILLEPDEPDLKSLIKVYRLLNIFIFENGLTKINVKKQYDKMRTEIENEIREL